MKAKKWISAFLAAVTAATMLFAGSVTASAASDDVYVDGFYNTSGEYCVRIGSYALNSFFSTIEVFKASGGKIVLNDVTISIEDLYMVLTVGTESEPIMAAYYTYDTSKDTVRTAALSSSANGNRYTLELNQKEVSGARWYNNGDGDIGTVFFLPKNSKHINQLASVSGDYSIYLTSDTYFKNDQDNALLESVDGIAVTPNFKELEKDSSSKSVSSLSATVKNQTYTGKARTPDVTIKDGSKTLKKGTDYTLTYKNNKKIGTASVTIKGKGDYSGEKTLTFKIVPKKTTLTAKKSGEKVNLSWKKVSGAEKYEIYYREKGESKYKKLATVSGGKTSYSTSKLNKNKTYEFKIRSYAESGGKKYYSSYSKVVTTK